VTVATEGLSLSDAPESDRLLVERIHAEHGQQLWGFARRQGLRDDEADEVVQEAMFRLLRQLRASPVDDPVAWSFRVAYRLSMDRHRLRRRRDRLVARVTPSVERPRPRADQDALLAVWTAVDRLPERQRQVLYLRYRADLAFDVIAAILGIDASSARSNASRGLATVRDALAEDDE
jgi:RNA polymerase sigma factor (sigma-70 family)